MKAQLLFDSKTIDAQGAVIQLKIWKVPENVPPTTHGYKYRLVYIRDGKRVIGFDNERGKGDHMHICDTEESYTFVSIDKLIDDFIAAVEKVRRYP